jgi:hypothetical protein
MRSSGLPRLVASGVPFLVGVVRLNDAGWREMEAVGVAVAIATVTVIIVIFS